MPYTCHNKHIHIYIIFILVAQHDILKGKDRRIYMENMNKQNEKSVDANNGTVLIVNPSSSSGSTGKNWDDFYLKVKKTFGENPEVAFSKKSGDGTILAGEYLRKGFKNVIAVGGDGTINEVANGFFYFNENNEKAVIDEIHSPADDKAKQTLV